MYRQCAVKECKRIVGRHGAKDFCPLHYRRFKIYGDPLYTKYNIICCIEKCTLKKQTKLGYCTKHYKRFLRGKDPSLPSRHDKREAILLEDHCLIPLNVCAIKGYAIVDLENKDLQKYQWSLSTSGYAQAIVNKEKKLMHHLLIGKPTKPDVTDHINRNKVDNRKINLRFVTERENALNKRYSKD